MQENKTKPSLTSRILPVVLWAAIIFIFSSNPEPYRMLPNSWAEPVNPVAATAPSKAEILGRFLHVAEYMILSILISRTLIIRENPKPAKLIIVLGLTALYALSDEIHQLFIPGRAFQLSDLALDISGAAVGIMIVLLGYKIIKNPELRNFCS
jgi:VanZ family protein